MMTDPGFPELLQAAIAPFLQRNGLRQVSESYSEAAFGNYQGVFRSDVLGVRITRERGKLYLEFASSADSDEWYLCDDVQQAIDIPIDVRARPELRDLAELAHALDTLWEPVATALGVEHYAATSKRLKAIERARSWRLLRRPPRE